tara:strand:+ start:392 stop:565 length:174 start_codon:yes stop_codon:yes gene_type:complete
MLWFFQKIREYRYRHEQLIDDHIENRQQDMRVAYATETKRWRQFVAERKKNLGHLDQ